MFTVLYVVFVFVVLCSCLGFGYLCFAIFFGCTYIVVLLTLNLVSFSFDGFSNLFCVACIDGWCIELIVVGCDCCLLLVFCAFGLLLFGFCDFFVF